jgi:hypothetical protein
MTFGRVATRRRESKTVDRPRRSALLGSRPGFSREVALHLSVVARRVVARCPWHAKTGLRHAMAVKEVPVRPHLTGPWDEAQCGMIYV